MAARPLEDWFRSIPPITKVYASACFMTTLAVHLEVINPLSLYLNYNSVFYQYEVCVYSFYCSFLIVLFISSISFGD